MRFYRASPIGPNYRQIDSIYRMRAIAYIKEHPWHYVSQTPAKWGYLFLPANVYLHPADGAGFSPVQMKLYGAYYAYQNILNRWLYIPVLVICWLGFIPLMSWRRRSYMFIALPVLAVTAATLPFVGAFRYCFIMLPWVYMGASAAIAACWRWIGRSARR